MSIQEMRWTTSGIVEKLNCNIYYCGYIIQHEFDNGFLVSNEHALLEEKEDAEKDECYETLEGVFVWIAGDLNAKNRKEIRKFYRNPNKIRKEFKPRTKFWKERQGNIPMDTTSLLNRWVEESRQAINILKNNKARGNDRIYSELYKKGGDSLLQIMY